MGKNKGGIDSKVKKDGEKIRVKQSNLKIKI